MGGSREGTTRDINVTTQLERLTELASKYGTDKGEHEYLPFYVAHLGTFSGPVVSSPLNLLEIGVQHGGSLRLWADFFPHPDTVITGIDIDGATCADLKFNDPRIKVIIGDARTEPSITQEFHDVIIDDGSHFSADIVTCINRLWTSVKPGGWYIIEDWQTQFSVSYGGTPKGSLATELVYKSLLRLMAGGTSEVAELHAYKKIVFLRKRS